MLKWYYVQLILQTFGFMCYLFQKIAICNDEKQIHFVGDNFGDNFS